MTTDLEARQAIQAAWPRVISRPLTRAEAYAVQATAKFESGYGAGWKTPPHGIGADQSNNWGAVQHTGYPGSYVLLGPGTRSQFQHEAAARPKPGPDAFVGLDSSPGKGWYLHAYRSYANIADAAERLIRILENNGTLAAVRANPSTDVQARRMYAKGYYQGTAATPELRILDYRSGLDRAVKAIAESLGEAPGLGTGGGVAPSSGRGTFPVGDGGAEPRGARLAPVPARPEPEPAQQKPAQPKPPAEPSPDLGQQLAMAMETRLDAIQRQLETISDQLAELAAVLRGPTP